MSMLVCVVLLPIAAGTVIGLILAHRSHGDDVAFDRTVGDQLDELPDLIAAARKSVMVTTDFEPRFFNVEETQSAFRKALKNGVRIRILTDGKVPEWYAGQKQLEIKTVGHVGAHVAVIDSRHVRLEKTHDHCRFGHTKGDVGLVFQGFPKLATKHAEAFETAWTAKR